MLGDGFLLLLVFLGKNGIMVRLLLEKYFMRSCGHAEAHWARGESSMSYLPQHSQKMCMVY